jgi:heme/copper-type cytochrome/quinol oxidase subunit 3
MAEASEERPLGLMIPPVPLGVEIPPEPADVGARALYIAGRLLAGATTFFFLAFVFAYFYLRSLNQNHLWRPPHIGPEQGYGVAIVLCLVASAALLIVAGRSMGREQSTWLRPAGLALLLGLAAVVLQCLEWTTQDFGPTDGAYASVFVGWTAFYTIGLLGALFWLETHVATELRARRSPAALDGDIASPDRLIKPGLDATVFYWSFLVGIGVLTYVVLYLV